MYYIFPFHLVDKDSEIVLYGAGNAGKNFVKQIIITNWCKIVGIVDKNSQEKRIRDIDIHNIEWLKNAKYDKILITQISETIQAEVKKELVHNGIEEEKIISFVSPAMDWDVPNRAYFSQKDEYETNKNIAEYIKEIEPSLLVSSKRIDVMVRYLLFKDFYTGIKNQEHLSLFSRFTFSRTGGVENPSYFSGNGKNSVGEFIDKARALCNSIKENGFAPQCYLPIGNDGLPYDGLHRLAATLVTGEKLWIREYNDRNVLECSMQWFKDNGFTFEDRVRINRAFADVYPGKCGMFILYAPFENLWNYIEVQVANRFCIVDVLDYEYENNYLAFENVLRQIYWDWNQYSEWLTRKLNLLVLSPLKYRVIIVSDEDGNESFYNEIRDLKLKLRDALSEDIDGRIPIQIHTSDNEDEFKHLKKIFLSVNQYKMDLHKTNQFYRPHFLNQIERLKTMVQENGISCDDVCIVGTFVMELYGLKEAGNVNFVVKKGIKTETFKLLDGFEFEKGNAIDKEGNEIAYDVIIDNSEYHTVFADIKFCNLEFVYEKKKRRMMEKDQLDIKKIENWFLFSESLKDDRLLKQSVDLELYKRGLKNI